MLCLVNWYVVTGIWKEQSAFMFRVKQPSKIVYFIVKIKGFLCLIKHHAVEVYGGMGK
jgi:hypothetical protein